MVLNRNKYRGGTSDATTLIESLIAMSFDGFLILLSKMAILIVRKYAGHADEFCYNSASSRKFLLTCTFSPSLCKKKDRRIN